MIQNESFLCQQTELKACFLPRNASEQNSDVCFYFCSTERNSELFSLRRNGLEQNSESLLLFLFHGTEFRAFSLAKWWNEVFWSVEQPKFRRNKPIVPSNPSFANPNSGTGPSGYIGWRIGTTSLCYATIRLYPPVRDYSINLDTEAILTTYYACPRNRNTQIFRIAEKSKKLLK